MAGTMDLTFDIGTAQRPRGHALLYFHARDGHQVAATYLLLLPIQMDMGKYIPPLLASQFGSIATGEMMSFAAPPMPEPVESVTALEYLAHLRDDDLVFGGTISLSDPATAMQETNEAVQAYARLYQDYLSSQPASEAPGPAQELSGTTEVQQVVYELMSDRDRLGEVSRLVGTMRFALDRGDETLARETDASLEALAGLLPKQYWIGWVRTAARDLSDAGATMARLRLERCYKLLEEDFAAVQELERQIAEAEHPTP